MSSEEYYIALHGPDHQLRVTVPKVVVRRLNLKTGMYVKVKVTVV
jgi:hypothetical protein